MEENNYSKKSWIKTLLLCWVAGIFGAHRTYVGKKRSAWIQFFTLGGLGIWALIDLYLIATQKFTDFNGNQIKNINKRLLEVVGIICIILCLTNICTIRNRIKNLKESEIFSNDNIIANTDIDANIKVFIELSANNGEIEKLKQEIERIEGVSSVEFESKEQGFSEYMQQFGDKAHLFESYADIVPNTYIVTVNNVQEAEKICDVIYNLENVQKVNNNYQSLQIINRQKNIVIFEKIIINIVFVYEILWILELVIIGIEILDKENKLRKNLEI